MREMKLFSILPLLFSTVLCGTNTNFDGSHGILYSPNYPSNYDNSETMEYTITVPDGHYIHLTFLDYSTEPSFDYTVVKMGTGDGAVAVTNYSSVSGNQTGLSIDINSSEATLVFTSDLTNTFRGFAIQFDSVLVGSSYVPANYCSSPLQISSFGFVVSPSFPENYPNNIKCSYLLNAPPNHIITIEFLAFDTEDGYDILYIYDGPNNSSNLIGFFSGKKLPSTITSTSNNLYLYFQSDLINNAPGFSALYTSIVENDYKRGVLPQKLTTDSGRRDVNILKWLKQKKSGIPQL